VITSLFVKVDGVIKSRISPEVVWVTIFVDGSASSPMPVLPSLEGQLLDGRYHLKRKLGEGAYGVVYEAETLFLGEVVKRVAVKFLSPSCDEAKARVLEEVQAMARLSHPHLLGFRTAGEVDLPAYKGDLFLVAEFADFSLEEKLRGALLSVGETLELVRHLALALEYLAQHRSVHRDLKPANILRAGNCWKIADFGLARTLENSATHISGVGGTPLFMAPESWRGLVTSAVDVWALGAIVQLALCGKPPFGRRTRQDQFIADVIHKKPFIASELPSPFDRIVRGCLEKSPESRPSARQILAWLEPASSLAQTPDLSAEPASCDSLGNEFRVAPDGSGDFPTLRAAIAGAPEGATIWLLPGIYREAIALEKSLHLKAVPDYAGRATLEWGESNVVKILGGAGSLEGIAIRGTAGERDQRFFAIAASGGTWTLTRCEISSDSLAALHFGGSANLKLHDCCLQSLRSDAVLVNGGGSCEFVGSTLRNSGRNGLQLKAAAQILMLEECVVEGNRANGILVVDGEVTLQKCVIADNGRAGMELGDAARVQLRRCRISGNGAQGVMAARGARGEISGCDLSGNRFGAYDIVRGSALERSGNKEF